MFKAYDSSIAPNILAIANYSYWGLFLIIGFIVFIAIHSPSQNGRWIAYFFSYLIFVGAYFYVFIIYVDPACQGDSLCIRSENVLIEFAGFGFLMFVLLALMNDKFRKTYISTKMTLNQN